MSSPGAPPAGERREQPGLAATIAEVSERASVLVREEIELAKTEIAEKASRIAKGAVVGAVAGIFFAMALFFVLVGCAWLLYYELPIGNEFTYFWGFFAMAVILVVLGALAGFVAARALRSGTPPTPEMAIEEARKIRATVSSPAPTDPSAASPPDPVAPMAVEPTAPPIPQPDAAAETETGKGGGYGTAIGG